MSKTIAFGDCCTSAKHLNRPESVAKVRQRGVSLIELMVGMFVGLMVVAVAGGTLLISRGISGTVSDTSTLQQQAGLAFRILGAQLRQAGSLYLNTNPDNARLDDENLYLMPVAFEIKATQGSNTYDYRNDSITGDNTTLTVRARRYMSKVFSTDTSLPKDADGDRVQSLARNCLGGPADQVGGGINQELLLQSAFSLDTASKELKCSGNSAAAQPLVGNVADFQMRYLQMVDGKTSTPKVQIRQAADVSDWKQVTGVEVCLELFGNEKIDPAGAQYTDCSGVKKAMPDRLHMVFRNIYQLRSQGL